MKKWILPIILGIIAGPLQMGIIYLLIGKNEKNNLFVFIGLILAFIIIYKLFIKILYKIIYRNHSFKERDELNTKTNWICKASFGITYFIMLFFIAKEGIVTSIFLSFIMVSLPYIAIGIVMLPFTNIIDGNNDSPIIKKVHLWDKNGGYAGEATTYNFGNYKYTDIRNKDGKQTGEINSYEHKTEYREK